MKKAKFFILCDVTVYFLVKLHGKFKIVTFGSERVNGTLHCLMLVCSLVSPISRACMPGNKTPRLKESCWLID